MFEALPSPVIHVFAQRCISADTCRPKPKETPDSKLPKPENLSPKTLAFSGNPSILHNQEDPLLFFLSRKSRHRTTATCGVPAAPSHRGAWRDRISGFRGSGVKGFRGLEFRGLGL